MIRTKNEDTAVQETFRLVKGTGCVLRSYSREPPAAMAGVSRVKGFEGTSIRELRWYRAKGVLRK